MEILNTKQEARISIVYTPVGVLDSYSEHVLESKYQKINDGTN